MVLIEYPESYAIVRLAPNGEVPAWAHCGEFSSITRTPEELSVICQEQYIPPDQVLVKGWHLIGCQGPLEFSAVGILAQLTAVLMEAGLSILTISTYNTDYILTRNQESTRIALQKAGHEVVQPDFFKI